jgi:hypothetical protein
MQRALEEYHEEVKKRKFPAEEHCYPIDDKELEKFYLHLKEEAEKKKRQ